jgi:hypothetical protein
MWPEEKYFLKEVVVCLTENAGSGLLLNVPQKRIVQLVYH